MENQWLDRKEYPFNSKYYHIDGNKLHYIDEGQGDTLLFVHGTPSWSFEYRNLVKNLRSHFRCIAIDHIGFGLSDKPEHYDYSTQKHSQTLERFILDKQLEDITLIVHDFGGPIGLSVAMKYPEKIRKLVILNSWLWSSKNEPEFKKLSNFLKSPLLAFLYRYLNFSARYLLPKSFGDHKLSRTILEHYTKPFADKTERNGPLAFARSLLNDQDWFEQLWSKKELIAQKPVILIWGMKDPVIPSRYLHKFRCGFRNSMALKLEGCGHFPQEEEPDMVTVAILNFLKVSIQV